MLKTRLAFVALIAAFGLAAPAVLAGSPPAVHSLTEGIDPLTERPTLTITGRKLNRFTAYSLTAGAAFAGEPEVLSRKSALLVLRLPGGLVPGPHTLTLEDRSGEGPDLPVELTLRRPLPGTIEHDALAPALASELHDAENLTGTVNNARFSAFSDLISEGKIGVGSLQLAQGDHRHDALYAATAHEHDGVYAPVAAAGARVHRSGSVSVSTGTVTVLTFDTEDFDTDALHDAVTGTGRLTAPSAGLYLVGARVLFTDSVQEPQVRLRRNGSPVLRLSSLSADWEYGPFAGTTVLSLSGGDYVEVDVSHASGSGRTVQGGDGATEFWMVRLGN